MCRDDTERQNKRNGHGAGRHPARIKCNAEKIDIRKCGKKKSGTVRAPLAPKYRNPETGETWSGRGKAPRWIDPSNKEKFLIK